jgi:hypothetical protein
MVKASGMDPLPVALPGTALRVLATTDLAAVLVPFRTSYGEGGSCAGVVELVEATRVLPYPLLCANVDVGLPASAMVESGVGPLGVIGLTHPHVHRLSKVPPPTGDWCGGGSRCPRPGPADGPRPSRPSTRPRPTSSGRAGTPGSVSPAAERYLPDLIAVALREATGLGPGWCWRRSISPRGRWMGVTAALRAGPVTELLDRDLVTEPASTRARTALLRTLERVA